MSMGRYSGMLTADATRVLAFLSEHHPDGFSSVGIYNRVTLDHYDDVRAALSELLGCGKVEFCRDRLYRARKK